MTDQSINNIYDFLNKNKIPYSTNNQHNYINIPNGIIKYKSYASLQSSDILSTTIQQIKTLLEQYDCDIYIIVLTNTNKYNDINETCTNITDNLYRYFRNKNNPLNRLHFCKTPTEILKYYNIYGFNYCINKCGAVWTLISCYDIYFKIFKKYTILIEHNAYYRAIVVMTDDEIDILNTYSIKVVNDIPKCNVCMITKYNNKCNTGIIYGITFTSLNGGSRKPLRLIEGLTTTCCKCNGIIYDDIKKKHYCEPIKNKVLII
jgi:hypothetical protein